jgi:glycosyltransferase involved in cell wall biosynthesis
MIKIIRHGSNLGLSSARNSALDIATGDYLMFVDSDDYLDKDVVEKLINKVTFFNADIGVFDMKHIYQDREYVEIQHISEYKNDYIEQLLCYKVAVCACGKIYKTALFRDNNIHFIDGLNFGEDYVVTPRIVYYSKKVLHCSDCYYNYVHYNPDSYTSSFKPQCLIDLHNAIDVLSDFFFSKNDGLVFKRSIFLAKIQIKIKLLILVCMDFKRLRFYLDEIRTVFPEVVYHSLSLPIIDRVLLWLLAKKYYKLLSCVVYCGYKIKQKIK